MESDRDEIQRQARARMQRISERIQTEKDEQTGNAIAGAKALDWLRISLEALMRDLNILVDKVDRPELGVLIRDRESADDLVRVTRIGRILVVHTELANVPSHETDDKEEMLDFLIERLAQRDWTARRARAVQLHATTGRTR